MATVYLPKGRNIYRVEFKDQHGKYRKISSGTNDKGVAESLGRNLEEDADRIRVGLAPRHPELADAYLGLVELRSDLDKSWGEGVEGYLAELTRTGSPKGGAHHKDSETLLKRIQKECGWKKLADVKGATFVAFLGRLAEAGRAPRTQNRYHETLRAACRFWRRQKWIKSNPLEDVKPVKVGQKGRRRLRRAYTVEELDRLCSAVYWEAHAVAYRVAAYSGLRWGELRRLTREDCTPAGPRPRWHIDASRTKNGQPVRLPMTPECAEALQETWEQARPGAKLLQVPRKETFKDHRTKAAIQAQDERGRWADFHSLRYTFCLWMSRLFPIEVVSKLMRHSSLNLTAGIYLDLGIDREGDGEWVLPRMVPKEGFPPAGPPAADKPPAELVGAG